MHRHSPNTINHTDCTCRTTIGGRNRYARAVRHATGAASGYNVTGVQPNRAAQSRCESGNGALFSFYPIGSDAAEYRASQRRHRLTTSRSFDRSAPVFSDFAKSIIWFTRGSINASAARGCAAEFGRTSYANPIIMQLSEHESAEAKVQHYQGNSSVRRLRLLQHGIPAVKQNHQVIQAQRSGIMPLFTRYSGCDSDVLHCHRRDSCRKSPIVSDKIRMQLSHDWILVIKSV